MIFLSREDESNLFQIDGKISKNIRSTLLQLGYLEDDQIDKTSDWSNTENAALELWFGVNNFENKWQPDNKIWKSVYDYLITEKGTPKVTIKKMTDLQYKLILFGYNSPIIAYFVINNGILWDTKGYKGIEESFVIPTIS